MVLMKKDMGGAAHVLGLAKLIMTLGLDVNLRVYIPAVENAIAGNAYRPSDIIRTRKGTTVEIGNTDAEGRVVLSDALTLACEEGAERIIDFATLTGAARIALGEDLPPIYARDLASAREIQDLSVRTRRPALADAPVRGLSQSDQTRSWPICPTLAPATSVAA
jgi:leucyl aminopeptidase